jgi:hypothetical protein
MVADAMCTNYCAQRLKIIGKKQWSEDGTLWDAILKWTLTGF